MRIACGDAHDTVLHHPDRGGTALHRAVSAQLAIPIVAPGPQCPVGLQSIGGVTARGNSDHVRKLTADGAGAVALVHLDGHRGPGQVGTALAQLAAVIPAPGIDPSAPAQRQREVLACGDRNNGIIHKFTHGDLHLTGTQRNVPLHHHLAGIGIQPAVSDGGGRDIAVGIDPGHIIGILGGPAQLACLGSPILIVPDRGDLPLTVILPVCVVAPRPNLAIVIHRQGEPIPCRYVDKGHDPVFLVPENIVAVGILLPGGVLDRHRFVDADGVAAVCRGRGSARGDGQQRRGLADAQLAVGIVTPGPDPACGIQRHRMALSGRDLGDGGHSRGRISGRGAGAAWGLTLVTRAGLQPPDGHSQDSGVLHIRIGGIVIKNGYSCSPQFSLGLQSDQLTAGGGDTGNAQDLGIGHHHMEIRERSGDLLPIGMEVEAHQMAVDHITQIQSQILVQCQILNGGRFILARGGVVAVIGDLPVGAVGHGLHHLVILDLKDLGIPVAGQHGLLGVHVGAVAQLAIVIGSPAPDIVGVLYGCAVGTTQSHSQGALKVGGADAVHSHALTVALI